jgi:hypothetical protein
MLIIFHLQLAVSPAQSCNLAPARSMWRTPSVLSARLFSQQHRKEVNAIVLLIGELYDMEQATE